MKALESPTVFDTIDALTLSPRTMAKGNNSRRKEVKKPKKATK